jgi:hypothetical protein
VDFLLFDLSALRYRWGPGHTAITVFTPLREILAVAPTDVELGDREAAATACDQALSKSFRPRHPGTGVALVRYRVGLYNPITAKISVGPTPKTKVFSDHAPLDIPPQGLVALLTGSGQAAALVVGQRRLLLVPPSLRELKRDFANMETGLTLKERLEGA